MELTRRKNQREIKLENGVPESSSLLSNRISTGKHSLHGFLLALVLNQCTRLSTLWFVIISVLAFDPFSHGYETSVVPCVLLAAHLFIAVTRDGVAMARRNISDRKLNKETFAVWQGDKFVFIPCEDIKIGQCLLIYDTGRVPADVVLLATSTEDGFCYISTANILGENNLDVKMAVKEMQRCLPNYDNPPSFNFHRLRGVARVSAPSPDYHSFEGKLKIHNYPRASVLDFHNFILRGSRVYSTSWILCLVVYVGMETKVWIDRAHAPRKTSAYMRALNYWTLCGVAFVLVVSAVMILAQFLTSRQVVTDEEYILYLLGLYSEVPISLYIGLDLVRILLMWRFTKNTKGSVFKYGYMSEDLAKVNFVLMDKTGTLTENKLKVTEIVIHDQVFRHESEAKTLITNNGDFNHYETSSSPRVLRLDTFDDLGLKMRGSSTDAFYYFCECISLCNSVIPVGKDKFKATSADEKALVRAARKLGCAFLSRAEDECRVEMFGTCVTYNVLCIRKFSPELRRMRVLIQGIFDEHATLYVKGNYAVLKDFLKIDPENRLVLEARLDEMAHQGLRTMLFCYRRIEGEQLAEVKQQAANIHLSKMNIEAKMEILLKDLEKELDYIGIVGIRDEVRQETLDCLDTIKAWGVQTWILSGDSESNTLATAHSLGLIEKETKVVSLRGLHTSEMCAKRLYNVAKEHLFHKPPEARRSSLEMPRAYFQSSSLNWAEFHPETVNFALSIDSQTFVTALKEQITRHFLISLITSASFTCFNTLQPSDKREVARLLMKGLRTRPVVLAIGDDGSNMPMILEADVGIGIARKVDSRAASNSDIALNHFSILANLLTDGKVNAQLLSQTALFFIYGTSFFELLKLAYMCIADVTPTFLCSLDFSLMYNAVVTLIPFVYLGVTNFHKNGQDFQNYIPALKYKNVAHYLLLAVLHASAILALVLPAFYVKDGTIGLTSELSAVLLIALVLAVNQHCWQEAIRMSLGLAASSVLSIGITLLYISTETVDPEQNEAVAQIFTSPRLVITVLCPPLACAVLSKLFLFVKDNQASSHRAKITPLFAHRSIMAKMRTESHNILDFYTSEGNAVKYDLPEANNFEINERQMRFKSSQVETNYIADFTTNNIKLLSTTALLFSVQLALTLPDAFEKHANERVLFALGTAGIALMFLVTWLNWKTIVLAHFLAVGFLIGTLIADIVTMNTYVLVYFSIPIGLLFILKEKWLAGSVISAVSFLVFSVDIIIHECVIEGEYRLDGLVESIGYIIVQGLTTYLAIRVAYDCDRNSRFEYKLIQEAEEKIAQSENILSCLLPDFVRKRVKDGTRYIAEDKDSVSVLFCEICDFDNICQRYSPSELTALLDDVFQKIDELCEAMGVAKIETVGKVYLACSGLSDFESELSNDIRMIPPDQRTAELALAILSSFRLYKLQTGNTLQFKIGINTGPVIAGVVGHHKPQFSLVGDTVNTASRMSTTITVPNTAQVSPSTYEALSAHDCPYDFQPNVIHVKGKGDMTAYPLRGKTVLEMPRTHRRDSSQREETGSARRRGNQRSTIGVTLRNSVNFDEAIELNDRELIEEVVVLPHLTGEQDSEKNFRLYIARRKLPRMRLGLDTYLVGFSVLATITFVQGGVTGRAVLHVSASIYVLALVCTGLIRVFLDSLYSLRRFSWMLVAVYVLTALGLYLELPLASEGIVDLLTLVICHLLVLMYYCSGVFFRHAVLGSVLIIVPWVCECISLYNGKWERSVFVLFFGAQHCIYMYFNEKNERTFFNLSKLAAREIEKTERLLTQMLPVHAYESLKHEEWVTDRLYNVTLLYADISGFTAWSSSQTPQEVITHLSQIYTAFDKICVRLKMYKVHTIGDCYVAMSATNNSESRDPGEECQVMLNFAEEMLNVLNALHSTSEAKLNMRIGLHIGDVVAGITGSKLIRYDIYGTDVLIANKMESNSVEGRINISEGVKRQLDDRVPGFVDIAFNKTVEIPEVSRAVNCYFVRNLY